MISTTLRSAGTGRGIVVNGVCRARARVAAFATRVHISKKKVRNATAGSSIVAAFSTATSRSSNHAFTTE